MPMAAAKPIFPPDLRYELDALRAVDIVSGRVNEVIREHAIGRAIGEGRSLVTVEDILGSIKDALRGVLAEMPDDLALAPPAGAIAMSKPAPSPVTASTVTSAEQPPRAPEIAFVAVPQPAVTANPIISRVRHLMSGKPLRRPRRAAR
jgi:hypothetical protein